MHLNRRLLIACGALATAACAAGETTSVGQLSNASTPTSQAAAAPATPVVPAQHALANPQEPDTQQSGTYVSYAGVATQAFGSDGQTLDPTQVAQGNEGDCGAIAGIIAVAATQPSMLTSHVQYMGQDIDQVDVYSIQLFSDGAWQSVTVSANMVGNQAQSLAGPTEIWGPLYEKAIAQLRGGYTNLDGINTTDVMTLLTGQSTDQVVGGGQQALAVLASGGSVTGVGVTTGWHDAQSGALLQDWQDGALWIYDEHYYAAAGFTDESQQTVEVINPWNQGEGDRGNFTMSAQGFANMFWGYGLTTR